MGVMQKYSNILCVGWETITFLFCFGRVPTPLPHHSGTDHPYPAHAVGLGRKTLEL